MRTSLGDAGSRPVGARAERAVLTRRGRPAGSLAPRCLCPGLGFTAAGAKGGRGVAGRLVPSRAVGGRTAEHPRLWEAFQGREVSGACGGGGGRGGRVAACTASGRVVVSQEASPQSGGRYRAV